MILADEIEIMAGSCCDALSAGRRLRQKDRRVSAFVQALSPRLADLHLRKHDNIPYVYNGKWWEQTTWKAVGDILYRILIRYKVMAPDALRVFAYLTPFVPSFEPELTLYAFTNCLYDVGTFTPLDFTDTRYCIRSMGYEFRPASKGRYFPSFLRSVLPSTSDQKAIQEFFGSAYIDRSRLALEKFLLMIGTGANGKSVLLKCVTAAMGPGLVSHLDPRQLCDERLVEGLRGKLMNIASDVRTDAQLTAGLKPLVSAEEVEGWELYKGRVTVKAPPLVFSMNHVPLSTDMSEGMRRRMLPVVFGVTIPEEERDPMLADKIVRWDMPGVFNWLIAGAKRIRRKRRFTEPELSARTVREIEKLSLPVLSILRSRGLYPEPLWKGQRPELMDISGIASIVDFDCSPQDITRNMTNAGFKSVISHGYRSFQLYRGDPEES